jgi:hypothetical protein
MKGEGRQENTGQISVGAPRPRARLYLNGGILGVNRVVELFLVVVFCFIL